jgi:predicted GIY-YIG superfamily endonuclease
VFYVYLITSIDYPEIFYAGYTTNIKKRLNTHNSGGSIYTSKYKPWKLESFFAFTEEKIAKNFEKYLKSQSGRAFAKKRLLKMEEKSSF